MLSLENNPLKEQNHGHAHVRFLDKGERLYKAIHRQNIAWLHDDIEVLDTDCENFLRLLATLPINKHLGGEVVKGRVIAITDGQVVLDIGLKTEGYVPLKEFDGEQDEKPEVGNVIEVFLESVENALGEAVLSREKVRYGKSWDRIESIYAQKGIIEGIITDQVRGGFIVHLDHVRGFLPGSQADLRPVRLPQALLGSHQKFHILKLDKQRGSVIVSRRSLLEEGRKERIEESLKKLQEGQIVEGVIKNLTDYGAFVDLNGFDGLLHVADMSWRRVAHPSEIVSPGDKVRVKVVRISPDFSRVSLGIKQLEEDPWKDIHERYKEGDRLKGRVVNIEDYGAFVEVDPGIEGLVHVSEMSWGRKNTTPSQVLSTGQEVNVQVLKVDTSRRRISLGMKQCLDNPWGKFSTEHPVGSTIEGTVRNIAEFGIFVALNADMDGLVHISDVSWGASNSKILDRYESGDAIKVQILAIDSHKGRISLGIKQMTEDPFAPLLEKYHQGDVVTCIVKNVMNSGINVSIVESDDVAFFIKRHALSANHSEQDPKRFHVGEKVDAIIIDIKKDTNNMILSIRALEEHTKAEAVKHYGSENSGAFLGDILKNHFDEKGYKKESASTLKNNNKKDHVESVGENVEEDKKEAAPRIEEHDQKIDSLQSASSQHEEVAEKEEKEDAT